MIPVQLVPEAHKPDVLPDRDKTCQGQQTSKLTIRQRRGKLFNELDLSGLDQWAPKMADKARQLLAEYHDTFLLDPAELGCTHSTKHAIKVTDDTPFKERFRHIPPPLVDEVRDHLRRCWNQVPLDPAKVLGVMLSYW